MSRALRMPSAGPVDARDLAAVRAGLAGIAEGIAVPGWDLAAHLTTGKLMRARLVLLAADVGPARASGHAVGYAQAVELLHAGGLVHDDLADRSPARRGRPTAWATLGPKAAVAIGSWLVACAAERLAAAPAAVRRAVARSLRDVVRGQTDELGEAFAVDASPESHLRRAYGKTGALYELAGWMGAVAGAAPARECAAVACFAARLGVAFQLADDLRDLVGGALLGREAGTDLRTGVLTMPLLRTLSGRHPGGERLRAIVHAGGSDASRAVLALVRRNGAWDASVREIEAIVTDARRALAALPPSPARDALAAVARDVVGPIDGPVSDLPRATAPAPSPGTRGRGLLAIDLVRTGSGRLIRRAGARARARLGRAARWRPVVDGAVATAGMLAIADEVGRARTTTIPMLVGLGDLLVADFLASAARMPATTVARALAVTRARLQAAVERVVAEPAAALGDAAAIDQLVDALVIAVRPSVGP